MKTNGCTRLEKVRRGVEARQDQAQIMVGGLGAAQVRVLADPKNEVASAMGVVWKIAGALGHDRSKRCGRLSHHLVRTA